MQRKHDIESLLQTGIDMMVAEGYHHTSINEVIKKAGMPKGSFYYLYKDKKAFALDVLTHYNAELGKSMDRFFSDEKYTPIEAIKAYFRNSINGLKEANYSWGCLLGNMAQELSDIDEDFRKIIDKTLDTVQKKLATQLKKAQEAGEINPNLDLDAMAEIIIFTWHGSLIRMKASRDKKPLDIFLNDFFNSFCNV